MPASDPPARTRRSFLKRATLATAAACAGAVGYTFFVEPFWWRVIRREMPIHNLPSDLVGRTLVQISDLHIGPRVDEAFMVKALKEVARLDPDLVVITGDLVHYLSPSDADQAARVLENLAPGRLGTLAILGNHDYGAGWEDEIAAADIERRATDLGIQVLRNETAEIAGLQIAGLDDFWAGRCFPEKVLSRLDAGRASLVLCHNPDALDGPGWDGYRGWILSGHTHGGQCKPPFLPPPLLPVRNKRYTKGEIDLGDGRRVYINPGLGYLRQVRFNVRPEVTVFTLRNGESVSDTDSPFRDAQGDLK